jgi:predicted NACHT family NTPase
MSNLPSSPQPDPRPVLPSSEHPSLWLYVVLFTIALGLIVWGFALQSTRDWAGLLLNLGAGLVGSIVILIFVDHRLRASEVDAIRRLPAETTRSVKEAILPTTRAGVRYSRALLSALQPLLEAVTYLPQFADLENKAREGFVLRGPYGQGKTTWTQVVSASLARRYLAGEKLGRIPVILPLARWLRDKSLHRMLYETFIAYTPCREWTFDRLLRSGSLLVLLDGYEELWSRQLPFNEEHKKMKDKYPKLRWVLTMRSMLPNPEGFGDVVDLIPLTDEEVNSILRRKDQRQG